MSFCESCGNLLMPRKREGEKILYCKTCDQEFPLGDSSDKTEYKIGSNNYNNGVIRSSTSKIIENEKKQRITEDDRETYEEFFAAGED